MAKSKKLTFNMLAVNMPKDEEKSVDITINGNTFTLNITPMLSFDDSNTFVRSVAAACYDMANSEYMPEALDFTLRLFTLIFYAGVSAPTSIDKAYDVLYKTNIYETVVANINVGQYMRLRDVIYKRVDFAKQCIAAQQSSRVNELLGKMEQMFEDSAEVVDHLSSDEFAAQINNIKEMFAAMNEHSEQSEETTVDNIVLLEPSSDE